MLNSQTYKLVLFRLFPGSQVRSIVLAFTFLFILKYSLFAQQTPDVSSQMVAAQTVVKTHNGHIRGSMEKNIVVFKGIPYARPATGKYRFMPPVEARNWKDTLSCTQFGEVAAQYNGNTKFVSGNEDCLSLNVYSPGKSHVDKLPVVIWVHGGAMISGDGKGMSGHAFSNKDSIITITINYRLGVFGFLYLGDVDKKYRSSGNNGLQDCIMALKWVKKNVSAFGGDPNRITVMGESAGAKLVSTLLATEKSKGLFNQLVLESGAVQCIRDTPTALAIRKRLMDTLQVSHAEDLLEISTEKLIHAQSKVCDGARGTNYFGPVLDGEVITDDPYNYIKNHPPKGIKLLIGINSAEAKMFIKADNQLRQPTLNSLRPWFGKNAIYVDSAYREATSKGVSGNKITTTVLSRYMYQLHSYRLANVLVKKQTPVWFYRFEYSRDNTGADHAQELPYVWFDGNNRSFNDEELRLARQMHQFWVNFIKNRNPGTVNNQRWTIFNDQIKPVLVFDRMPYTELMRDDSEDNNYPSFGFVLD